MIALPVIAVGDFSIHIKRTGDPDAIRLIEQPTSFSMIQHNRVAIHILDGTLDVIIAFSDEDVNKVRVDPLGMISDYWLVVFSFSMCSHIGQRIAVRGWSRFDRSSFTDAAPLGVPPPTADVPELFQICRSTLRDLEDCFAPAHTVEVGSRPSCPLFDAECRVIHRNCRMLERRYRRSKTMEEGLIEQKQFVNSMLTTVWWRVSTEVSGLHSRVAIHQNYDALCQTCWNETKPAADGHVSLDVARWILAQLWTRLPTTFCCVDFIGSSDSMGLIWPNSLECAARRMPCPGTFNRKLQEEMKGLIVHIMHTYKCVCTSIDAFIH